MNDRLNLHEVADLLVALCGSREAALAVVVEANQRRLRARRVDELSTRPPEEWELHRSVGR